MSRAKASQAVREFLEGSSILVVEPQPALRARIFSALVQLGARPGTIEVLRGFAEARTRIGISRPRVLIADFGSEAGPGTELARKQKIHHPPRAGAPSLAVAILVARTPAEARLARELDATRAVDLVMTRPFEASEVAGVLVQLITAKIAKAVPAQRAWGLVAPAPGAAPEPRSVAVGRDLERAIESLGAARMASLGLQSGPGLREQVLKLFDSLIAQGRWRDAHDLARAAIACTPALLDRLEEVVKIAVRAASWDDLETYYRLYTQLDRRPDSLVRAIWASLIVAARHFYANGQPERATDLMRKAALVVQGRPTELREIIRRLVEHGRPADARHCLERFARADRAGTDFVACEYFVLDRIQDDAAWSIHQGRRLIEQRRIHDPLIYRVLIRRLWERGKWDGAEHLADQAARRWPAQKAFFDRLIGAGASTASPFEALTRSIHDHNG
jgi:CheY-like chemotaxis protein